MDYIDENWVIRTDELADLYERGDISIDCFSDDQLMYLVYWNFGVSGAYTMPETTKAMDELIKRNNPYFEEYAELISNKVEEFC